MNEIIQIIATGSGVDYSKHIDMSIQLRRATGWVFATKLLFRHRVFLSKPNPDTKSHRVRHKRVGFSSEKSDPLRGVSIYFISMTAFFCFVS